MKMDANTNLVLSENSISQRDISETAEKVENISLKRLLKKIKNSMKI